MLGAWDDFRLSILDCRLGESRKWKIATHKGRGRDPDRSGRGACLAPCEDAEWSLLLRWENVTDRGVERKMRQYFRMRGRYRQRKGEENKRKN